MEIASKSHGVVTGLTDQETADYLEKIPGSLGFLSLSVVKGEGRRLSIIALNEVQPSTETIESGAYPSQKTFYFVWKTSGPATAQIFVDFASSRSAKELMETTGHSVLVGSK